MFSGKCRNGKKYRSEYAMTHTWVYLDDLEPFLKFLKTVPRNVPWKIPSFRVFQNPQYLCIFVYLTSAATLIAVRLLNKAFFKLIHTTLHS